MTERKPDFDGELPGVGTKFQLNGNTFRINYTKPSKDGFRFSADLVKKRETNE